MLDDRPKPHKFAKFNNHICLAVSHVEEADLCTLMSPLLLK